MSASTPEPETLPFASKLADLSARQDIANDERWEQVSNTARSLADRLRSRDGEVDEHTALGQTPLPRTLTALINEALATPSNPSEPALSAVFELLRTSANFCMDHDDNRQLLLAASFPQSIVSLLQRYSIVQTDASRPLSLSFMELKILKTSAGVLLNTSLHFDPVREYLVSANVPATLIRLQGHIYPPGSWSALESQTTAWGVKEEWLWRSGFRNWASLALSELLRDNNKPRILSFEVLSPLVAVLARFTPPYATHSGPLVEDPTARHALISADVDALNDASSLLESLALDSEDVQVFLARSATSSPSETEPGPLLKSILDFVEFGTYPPYWSNETSSEREKRQKSFDLCKAAIIKTVVEVTGATRCIDTLWDLSRANGWFVSRMVNWIRANAAGHRDDLVVCATLSLGNLARRESHCVALVQSPFSVVQELLSLLDVDVDIKLKHGALGLLKHLSQSPTNRSTLGEAGILDKLAKSQVWSDKTDMAETVQLSAIGTAKHLCAGSAFNAIQLALSRADASLISPTGIDQILALIKRSDTIAVKSEGARVVVNAIKSLCSNAASDETLGQRRDAINVVSSASSATALAELVGRSKRYPVLISEGIVGLTLLSLQPSGGLHVAQALLAPLPMDPTPTTSRSTSQSSQASPVSSPATCLSMLHNILTDVDGVFPAELRVNACSLLGSVGRKNADEALDASFLRENSGGILASLVHAPQAEVDDRIRRAAERALQAWN